MIAVQSFWLFLVSTEIVNRRTMSSTYLVHSFEWTNNMKAPDCCELGQNEWRRNFIFHKRKNQVNDISIKIEKLLPFILNRFESKRYNCLKRLLFKIHKRMVKYEFCEYFGLSTDAVRRVSWLYEERQMLNEGEWVIVMTYWVDFVLLNENTTF